VFFTYVSSEEQAHLVVQEGEKYNVKITAVKSDASDYHACEQLINMVIEEYEVIDILVNNAGITKDKLLLRMTELDFQTVLDVNMNSVFNMTKAIQKSMLKVRRGTIINLSSIVGLKGNIGQSNYAASKSAIIGFSKSIALELGSRNIRCNVIAPGYIDTEMTKQIDELTATDWTKKIPLKRTGSGEDVANTVLFLSSEMSSYITGQVISVCGGLAT